MYVEILRRIDEINQDLEWVKDQVSQGNKENALSFLESISRKVSDLNELVNNSQQPSLFDGIEGD